MFLMHIRCSLADAYNKYICNIYSNNLNGLSR